MTPFKVGDIVTGLPKADDMYDVTEGTYQVISIKLNEDSRKFGTLTLRVLTHKSMPQEIGEEYNDITPEHFKLVKPTTWKELLSKS